eukprot:GHVS01098814.1.p1 GENE.GHVS01098814.1~~GHVS01098814.1.p1  ORF type:complete len:299 (+),score=14.77 GHVS01098814.1:442-1338(+)
MKLSRCSCLGVLVVGVGTARAGDREYKLGAGSLHMREPGQCSDFPHKLSLKHTMEEVVQLNRSNLNGSVADAEAMDTSQKDGNEFLSTNKSAMFYHKADKVLSIFTTEVLPRRKFMSLIERTKGEYQLVASTGLDLLEYLPGFTVCIDDAAVIDVFRKDHPRPEDWEKRFTDFYMKDHTLRIREPTNLNITVTADSNMESTGRIDRAYLKCGKVIISSADITANINEMRQELASIEAAEEKGCVYGKGCEEFAIKYSSVAITRELSEEKGFRELGIIANWAGKPKDQTGANNRAQTAP